MPRKVRQIDDLVIDEISLVDKGANQHAAVTIAKSADGEKENKMEIFDQQGNPLDEAALEDGDVVFDSEGNAFLFEIEDEGAAEGADQEEKEEQPVGKSAGYTFPKREPVKKSKSFADDIREELSKALTDKDRDDIISKALGAVDTLAEEVSKAREAADHERTIRLEREYTEIAKSYNLPVEDDKLGGVLMRCAEALSREDCEVISKCLEAAGEALFEEYGNVGGGDNSDIFEQVNAHVDAVVSKAQGRGREELTTDLFMENPDLYDEYLREQRG